MYIQYSCMFLWPGIYMMEHSKTFDHTAEIIGLAAHSLLDIFITTSSDGSLKVRSELNWICMYNYPVIYYWLTPQWMVWKIL